MAATERTRLDCLSKRTTSAFPDSAGRFGKLQGRCSQLMTLKASIAVGALAVTIIASPVFAKEKPRLILQITVDQLRGDLPTRFASRFGQGGLRYLIEKGVYYDNAHHAHSNTETIVGHATLATGAHPAAHGMVGNLWFDRVDGRVTYNIEDPDYRLLTEGAGIDAATEIDPTQKLAKSDGRTPRAILTSTFSADRNFKVPVWVSVAIRRDAGDRR